MKFIIHQDYLPVKTTVEHNVRNFKKDGRAFGKGERNVIKLFSLSSGDMNIKSFKVPNIINKVAYTFFRKSKAERSYLYAVKLLENGIGTPKPIAYAEEFTLLGLGKSFYVSEHLVTELTFRDLVDNAAFPDHENILRQFTRFCFELHEKGIEFLDHSPGNTLIKHTGGGIYEFYLVDLNRMKFHSAPMDEDTRIHNMKRLTHIDDMAVVMSNEYAKLYHVDEALFLRKFRQSIAGFHSKLQRKRRIKKKLKFWKQA